MLGRSWAAMLLAGLVASTAAAGTGAVKQRAKAPARSNRGQQQEALQAFPASRLSADDKRLADTVLDHVSLFRRLPEQNIECDGDLYRFLVERPHLLVNLWEAMGITEVTLSRSDDGEFQAGDKAGSEGVVRYLYSSPSLHVIYAEGAFKGVFFAQSIPGRCLLVLRTRYYQVEGRPARLACRLDAFVRVEQRAAEFLAKTFQPLVAQAADHNFRETANFMAMLCHTAQSSPSSVGTLALKLDKVSDEERNEFTSLTDGLAVKAALLRTNRLARKKPRPATSFSDGRSAEAARR